MGLSYTDWIYIAFAVSGFVGTAIFVVLLCLILFSSTGYVRRLVAGLGADQASLIIGFALANLLLPSVVPSIVEALVTMVSSLFQVMPSQLSRGMDAARDICGQSEDGPFECVGRSGIVFLGVWLRSLSDALRVFEPQNIPYVRCVILLALWVMTSLSLVSSIPAQASAGGPQFLTALRAIPSGVRQNILFFLILGVGVYLSVAAIAAIPYLTTEDPASDEVGPQKLRQSVEATLSSSTGATADTLDKLRPNFGQVDSVIEGIEKPAAQSSAAGPTQITGPENAGGGPASMPQEGQGGTEAVATTLVPPPKAALDDVKNYLKEGQEYWNQLVTSYKNVLESTLKERKNVATLALNEFEANSLDLKRNRDRRDYYLAMSDWIRQQFKQLDASASDCHQAIESFADEENVRLANLRNMLRTWDSAYISETQGLSFDRRINVDNARLTCDNGSNQINDYPPQRPEAGSSLGPFRIIARWLVSTESLHLVLITGLLGFGLLGSACSTFVKEQRAQKKQKQDVRAVSAPLVEGLASVIIRGLSAAIVVFLAVEGGLGLFSSTTVQPNPYVLLFTCLVAAVYSDTVWDWAHRRLKKDLNDDADQTGGDEQADSGASKSEAIEKGAQTEATDASATSE